MKLVGAPTLEDGWLAVSRAILDFGADATYDEPGDQGALASYAHGRHARPEDEVTASLADHEWLAWMRSNLTSRPARLRKKAHGNLVELGRLPHEVAEAVGVPVGASSSMPSRRTCTSRSSS